MGKDVPELGVATLSGDSEVEGCGEGRRRLKRGGNKGG